MKKIINPLLLVVLFAAPAFAQDIGAQLGGDTNSESFTVKSQSGTVVLKADADGEVGINNASPAYDLDVIGDINATGKIRESGNAVLPAGTIICWAGTGAVPSGFLECNGASVASAAYPALFSAIGNSYGGIAPNFILPDLRGRVIVAQDAGDASFDAMGETGGSKTHALATGEIPAHAHADGSLTTDTEANHLHNAGSYTSDTESNHSHNSGTYNTDSDTHTHSYRHFLDENDTNDWGTPTGDGSGSGPTYTTGSDTHDHDVAGSSGNAGSHNHSISGNSGNAGSHSHDVTGSTASAGGGGVHNNLQPYFVLRYLIKF